MSHRLEAIAQGCMRRVAADTFATEVATRLGAAHSSLRTLHSPPLRIVRSAISASPSAAARDGAYLGVIPAAANSTGRLTTSEEPSNLVEDRGFPCGALTSHPQLVRLPAL